MGSPPARGRLSPVSERLSTVNAGLETDSTSAAGPLIGVAELAELLDAPARPVVFDARWSLAGPPGIEEYLAGHIPGACFIDLDLDLADPPGSGGRHPLPAVPRFERAMRAAGLSRRRLAIAYDAADATSASRLWWLLRYHGHDLVRVLDGGFAAWRAAGLPVAIDLPLPVPGDFSARPGRLPVLDAAGAAAVARSGVLLDSRASERYRGEREPVDPVAGHIPGAVSLPAAGNTRPDGRFRSPVELRARLAAAGVALADGAGSDGAGSGGAGSDGAGSGGNGTPDGLAATRKVAAYCGSGVVATQQLLALELAGYEGAALYPGSWSEWITDPTRPVATGPEAG